MKTYIYLYICAPALFGHRRPGPQQRSVPLQYDPCTSKISRSCASKNIQMILTCAPKRYKILFSLVQHINSAGSGARSSDGRALRSQRRGREFDPLRVHQKSKNRPQRRFFYVKDMLEALKTNYIMPGISISSDKALFLDSAYYTLLTHVFTRATIQL